MHALILTNRNVYAIHKTGTRRDCWLALLSIVGNVTTSAAQLAGWSIVRIRP